MFEGRILEQGLKVFITLGDSALLLALAFAVLIHLWIDRDPRRLVRSWILLSVTCGVLTLFGKVSFHLLGLENAGLWGRYGPNGHVAITTAVYGGCASLLSIGRTCVARTLIWSVVGALLAALALS